MSYIGAMLTGLGAIALIYALSQKLADSMVQRERQQLRNWRERQR